MKKLAFWLQAARPPAFVNIGLPLAVGQALAAQTVGEFSSSIFIFSMLLAVSIQLYIVFLNDFADHDADRRNADSTPFSGGSRVLVQGKLLPENLRRAGFLMLAVLVLASAILALWLNRPFIFLLIGAGVVIFQIYSFPPFKMSYRGGGELLQAFGCGAILPITGFYLQTGGFDFQITGFLASYVLLQLTSAITTAIPDKRADAQSEKRTLPVMLGEKRAARLAVLVGLIGIFAMGRILEIDHRYQLWLIFMIPAMLLISAVMLSHRLTESKKRILTFCTLSLGAVAMNGVGICTLLIF